MQTAYLLYYNTIYRQGLRKITKVFIGVTSLNPDLKAGPLELKQLCVLLASHAVLQNKIPQYLKRVTPI